MLDLKGNPKEIVARNDDIELDVTIGAGSFSYTRSEDEKEMPDWKKGEFKMGTQLYSGDTRRVTTPPKSIACGR